MRSSCGSTCPRARPGRSRSAPSSTGSPAPTRSASPNAARWRSTCPIGGAGDRRPALRRMAPRAAAPARQPGALRRRAATASRSRSRFPPASTLGEPYLFPADDGVVDYAAPQSFRRDGDTLVASLKAKGAPPATLLRRARARRRARAVVHRHSRRGPVGRAQRRRPWRRARSCSPCLARSSAGCCSTSCRASSRSSP